jgi:hypothetical protein
MNNPQNPNPPEDGPFIDRPFTYRVTVASLIAGFVLTGIAAFILFSISRPVTVSNEGEVQWSIQAFLMPISAIICAVILFWSIFQLPVRIAKRVGVILDPEIWPWTGAVIAGVIFAVGFVAAILFGII